MSFKITCTLLQTDNHTSMSPVNFFYRLDALPEPNQQCQSTEGKSIIQVLLLHIQNLESGFDISHMQIFCVIAYFLGRIAVLHT